MLENTTPRDSSLTCLTLIARHFQTNLAVPGLIQKYGLSGPELPLGEFLRVIEDMGFKAKATRLSVEDLFSSGRDFPILARTAEDKSFLISGARGEGEAGRIAVLDPSSGKPEISLLDKQQLAGIWDGAAILVKRHFRLTDPDQPFSLRWFAPEFLRQAPIFRDVIAATLVINILKLAFPIYFQIVLDKVMSHHGLSTLNVISLAMIGIFIVSAVLEHIRDSMLTFATRKTDLRLGNKTFDHLLGLPMDFFERVSSGILLKNLGQTEKIREFLTGKLLMSALNCSMLFVLLPILYLYSWILASITLGFALVIAFTIFFALRPFKSRLQNLYREDGRKQSHLVETLRGIHTVKALSLEPVQCKHWDAQANRTVDSAIGVRHLSAGVNAVIKLLESLMKVSILFFGIHLALDQTITVGSLIAINIIAGQVTSPLVQIVSALHEYQEIGISVEMLGRILNRPRERPKWARGLVRPLSGQIVFDNVTFRYAPGASPALVNVSLTIPAGTMVGVVGRSGSGKSTVARLIQCLYPLQEGVVRIDGQDARSIELTHLRKNIGVVLQDNFLFSGTVRQNIALTKPTAAFEEIVQAARMAGAEEFIQRLPQGYDTMLDENGANLSGGQRQRLAIARALAANPRVLILDEATSALDAESESIIQSNLAGMAKGRTVLMISHRLSMLLDCHKIIVLDEGRVIGDGTHAELLERCPLYRDLWMKQNRQA